MMSSDLLIQTGEKYYGIGRALCKVLLISTILLVVILVIAVLVDGVEGILYVIFIGSYDFVNVLTVLVYLGVAVGMAGPAIYFNGLKLIGLGQIARNTALLYQRSGGT